MATIELVRESKSHEEGMVPPCPTPPQSSILTFLPLGQFFVNHVTTLNPPFPFLRLPSLSTEKRQALLALQPQNFKCV